MKFFIYDDNPVRSLGLISLAEQKSISLSSVSSLSYLKSSMLSSGSSVAILSQRIFLQNSEQIVATVKKLACCRIMCLIDNYSHSLAKQLIDLGCSAVVLWSDVHDIIKCMLTLRETDYYLQPSLLSHLLKGEKENANSDEVFSMREVEVLQFIFEENSAKEIASKLCLSTRTVEWHRRKMMEKVGAKNMIGLVKYGLNNGFISFQKE